MSSIVLDLQNEVTKPDCDIVNVLRKAHLIAAKLNLQEFDKWIMFELNGYNDSCRIDDFPEYRKLKGLLKGYNPHRGWIPILIPDDKTEEILCQKALPNSVSEILLMNNEKDAQPTFEYTGENLAKICQWINPPYPTRIVVEFPKTAVADVIEKVKNTVLEWTIRLETEGILGEDMVFNDNEKETAKAIPQTVNNYYGNVINGSVDHSAVISGDNNVVTFTFEKASQAVAEIESSINGETIAADDRETALEMLSDIKDKLVQQKKPSIIKSALIGLKDFLIGVSASATVALIQAKIQGLF